MKMGFLSTILFFISATAVSCTEYVPVLIWSTQASEDSLPVVPALSKLTSSEFSDYLLKRVKVEKPVILAFMEENLSVEDFSWKDLSGNGAFPMVQNITRMADALLAHTVPLEVSQEFLDVSFVSDVAFLPSVHDPYKALKRLKNHGYLWKNYEKDSDSLQEGKNVVFEVKLDEPDFLEDRPDMLKRHDEKIARIYNEALTRTPNLLVVYSGSHTSWMDAELGRFKREEKDMNGSNSLVISDMNNVVRIVTKSPIVCKLKGDDNKEKVVEITEVHGNPTIKDEKDLVLRVRFPMFNKEDDYVDFKFTSEGRDWWTLNSIDIEEMKQTNLVPTTEIGAPSTCSYFCNPTVTFTNGNATLIFENFQAQPRVGKGNSFGPVVHCIPFFSIAIISGLITVFILGAVLAWGITMIMDINTNDRFDDPKGKTITITATD